MRTLYLLGNGFDLACGLKSRYADYFESRFKWYKGYNSPESKAIPALYEEIQDGGIENIPSAWFIVFAHEHDKPSYNNERVLWKDIEEYIDLFLCDKATETDISIGQYSRYLSQPKSKHEEQEHTPSREDNTYKLLNLYFQKKNIITNSENPGKTLEDLSDIFDNELNKLEIDFVKYLRTIDKDHNYQASAQNLFRKIQNAETTKQIENTTIGTVGTTMIHIPRESHDEFIMSFNYTRPLDGESNYVNLHGEESQNTALFGIADDNSFSTSTRDTRTDLSTDYRYPFFKDTRRQQKESLDLESTRIINNLSNHHIDEIKCFGCSFSNADFDYFRRYFDLAQFDSTDSTLGIYYKNGVQRKSVIKDVRTVLNEYDSVIESSNNTYQTLETEGRLFIKKI